MRVVIAPLLVTAFASLGAIADWPAFRGPGGQGHSNEAGVPTEWSESANVLWKTPVPGLGWSSPVVAGGRVWVTSATGEREVSLRVLAFDVETGKPVVDVEVERIKNPRHINQKNSWASPTPVVEGERVYVHFGAEGTAALATSGEIVWKKKFSYESQHGAGGSPVLYGDLLIFSCDGSDAAFVVALDKQTGKARWKTNRREPADQAYTTPLVIRVGDRDQLVSVGAYRARAYDPLTGKEIWRVRYDEGFSNVPRPVYGNGLIYIATGFQQPTLIAVRPDGSGEVTKTHIAWTLTRGAPLTPSPLLVGDELYVVNDGGILTCLDATTGGVIWQRRLGGSFSASPIFADGRIYLPSEQGVTVVIAPGREFKLLAMNTLDGPHLASMAVSNGSIFLRTQSHLYRVGATPKPTP
jgi:outer membrane protein assembly factor BamB